MLLLEDRAHRARRGVATYIPEFGRYGKQRITIRHLLTHVSGLRPISTWRSSSRAQKPPFGSQPRRCRSRRPGSGSSTATSTSSCSARSSRESAARRLDAFARDAHLRAARHARDAVPAPSRWLPRIAPTEACAPLGWPCGGPNARMLRGIVHDPTARRMGGVAGHAGLFSTAADLSRFCRMLLNGGSLDGVRLLSPLTVALMTRPATPAALGRCAVSAGTSTPASPRTAERCFRSARSGTPHGQARRSGSIHSHARSSCSSPIACIPTGRVTSCRCAARRDRRGRRAGRCRTAVRTHVSWAGTSARTGRAAGVGADHAARADRHRRAARGPVRAPPREARRALTNHTGRSRDGASTIDVLRGAPGVTLVALFSPEHGIRGILDADGPVGARREDGPADLLAVRRHAAAHRRHARRASTRS